MAASMGDEDSNIYKNKKYFVRRTSKFAPNYMGYLTPVISVEYLTMSIISNAC